MQKNNRQFSLEVETNDGGVLTILPPFTVDFSITRNTLSSANVATIRVYNLSETNRTRILKDRMEYDNKKRIFFKIGYGRDLSYAMTGDVARCYSSKEGINMVTTIECFDAGYAYINGSLDNVQYPKGTTKQAITEDMIQKLSKYGISRGKIGDIEGELSSRGASLNGSIISNLSEITGNRFFIDNGKAYVLAENEYYVGTLREIDSSVGLLGSPIRENLYVEFTILLEPRLNVGQSIVLNSSTVKTYNNKRYKVVSVRHQGTISESVCGRATTTIGCFIGDNLREVL